MSARWILSLVGLLAAGGFGLLSCGGGSEPVADFSAPDVPGDDLIVAEVGGQPITAGHLYHKIRIQYPQMASTGPSMALQAREVLGQVITERCFEEMALSKGYDRDPEFLRMMYLSRLHLLTRVTVREGIAMRSEPTEEELRAFYEEEQERFRITPQARYRHILCDSETEAQMVRLQLEEGSDFSDLASRFSRDRVTAQKGGEMPPADASGGAGHLGNLPELTEAAMRLPAGEISEPIRSEKGWHIIQVDWHREGRQREFEEVREEIAQKLRSKGHSQLYGSVLDSLKTALGVRYFDDALEQFYFVQMDDEQLFSKAQGEQDAARKVRMYEQILSRFPESEHCPEALFMIGFERAERMADTTGAVEAFERFLSDYPDHEMVPSAELMLGELRP